MADIEISIKDSDDDAYQNDSYGSRQYVEGDKGDSVDRLCQAIRVCLAKWGDDPAYSTTAQKLREVLRELDVLIASPGHRAALRALPPVPSGQEPAHREEPKSGARR